MVFVAPAAPFVQMPPPMAAAVTQGVGSGTHLGSIPTQIVPSTIVAPEIHNNRQGMMPANYGQTGTVALFTAPPNFQALMPTASMPNHSVAFFAQLLSQSGPGEQLTLTQTFRDPVPSFSHAKPEVAENSYSSMQYNAPNQGGKPTASHVAPPGMEQMEQVKQPHTVYTRKYQIAQRYQIEADQMKVDVSKLMQGGQSRESTSASSSFAGAASEPMSKGIREFSGTQREKAQQAQNGAVPNNMVYQEPSVNYGRSVQGANAYLSALSLFNPPSSGPLLGVL